LQAGFALQEKEMLNPLMVGALAFAGIFSAAMLGIQIGVRLRLRFPDHLSNETKDSVRLGMGLIATMTALLLGLLVASAKGSYDTQRSEVIQLAARIAFIDRVLDIYGSEAAETRQLLRRSTENVIVQMWPDHNSTGSGVPDPTTAVAMYNALQKLSPPNDAQRALKEQALQSAFEIAKTRWLLFAQRDRSIAMPVLVAVVFWLAIIFLSFGVFAPANKMVTTTLLIVALSVCSAIFLMLELDRPFDGVIRVSSEPMRSVLRQLDH
jgi:hypothetical protein